MMHTKLFDRYEDNPILTSKCWPYKINSVFNCGATKYNGETLLLVRVEDMTGKSHFTVAKSKDGLSNWKINSEPSFCLDPNCPEETWGIEDPRIIFIKELNEYLITYTAYSEYGPLVSLVKTKDFKTFNRIGPVMLPENKDAALFPIRFDGRWAMIHRPVSGDMWISFSFDLKYWGDHKIIIKPRGGSWWDSHRIGLSPEPIRIPEGWLVLYHGVKKTGGGVLYRLGLALLDSNDPTKLLRRSNEWIFGPQEYYERVGDVDNVVFSNGWVIDKEKIYLYYGGADTCLGVATANLNVMREYIMNCPIGN